MPLSDIEIWAEINAGRLIIDPIVTAESVGGSSLDLLLHEELRIFPKTDEFKGLSVEPTEINYTAFMERNSEVKLISLEQPYKMKPGEFLHGKTHERIKLPTHLAGMIEGRSSLARLGLGVHITAPTVQTGFEGRLVLEMCNHGPFTLELKPRMKIAQLVLEHLSLPASGGYSGQYQGQK